MKVMVIIKASKGSEAGEMPSTELLIAMGKYNEELANAGITGSTIEHTGQSSLAVSIEGLNFLLLAKRGLYWPEQRTLFIADTHFGKEATFRSQGVAVSRGSTPGTLSTIARMISDCQA